MDSSKQCSAFGGLHERDLWQEPKCPPGHIAQRDNLVKKLLTLQPNSGQLNLHAACLSDDLNHLQAREPKQTVRRREPLAKILPASRWLISGRGTRIHKSSL